MQCPNCNLEIDNHPANRCLDSQMAELMGWELIPDPLYDNLGAAMNAIKPSGEKVFLWYLRKNVSSGKEPWTPSRDIAAAYLMEERIEELGLIEEYCQALEKLLFAANWEENSIFVPWLLVHASPEDRCRAALMAAEAE